MKINYKEEQDCVDKGYKYLGWQLSMSNEDYKKCYEAGHMNWNRPEGRCGGSVQHTQSGSNCTDWCDECKTWWKTDVSG